MKYLSKANYKLAVHFQENIEHFAAIEARSIAKCPNLPSWFTDKPASYYEGLKQGNIAALEHILHSANKYQGYQDRKSKSVNTEFEYPCYYFDVKPA